MNAQEYEIVPPLWEGPYALPPVDPDAVQIPPPTYSDAFAKGTKRFRPQNSTQGPPIQAVKARKLEEQSHAPALVVQHKLAKQGDLQMPMDHMRVAIRRHESRDGRESGDSSPRASDSEVEHQLFLTEMSRENTPQPFQPELTLSDLQPSHQGGMGATTPVDSSPSNGNERRTIHSEIAQVSATQAQDWPSGSMVRADERNRHLSEPTEPQQPTVEVANTSSEIPRRASGMDETLRGGQHHYLNAGGQQEGRAEQGIFAPQVPTSNLRTDPVPPAVRHRNAPPPSYIPPAALPSYPPFDLTSYGYQRIYAAAYQQPQAQEVRQPQAQEYQQWQVPQYQQQLGNAQYQQPQIPQYQQPQAPQYVYPGQHPWNGHWNSPWNGHWNAPVPTNQIPMQHPYTMSPGVAATGRNTETGQQSAAAQHGTINLAGVVGASMGEALQAQTGPVQGRLGCDYQTAGQERVTPMEVDGEEAERGAEVTSEGEHRTRPEPEGRASEGIATPTETETESEGGGEGEAQSDAVTDMDTETETETETNSEAGVEKQVKAERETRQEEGQKRQKRMQEQNAELESEQGLEQGIADRARKEEGLDEENPVAGPSKRRVTFREFHEEKILSPEPPSPTSEQRTRRREEKAPAGLHRDAGNSKNTPSVPAETRTFQMRLLEKLSALPSINQHLEDLKARADASEDVQEEILSIMGKVDQRVTALEQSHNAWAPLVRKRQAERTRRQATSEMLRNLSSATAGTDADDEEDTDGQGEASHRRERRSSGPGISRSAKNLVVSELRKHVKAMLKIQHLRELPAKFPPLTQEDIEAYETKREGAPQTSSLHLRIDFESPWKNFAFNEDAKGAIIADFNNVLQEGRVPSLAPYLDAITPEVIGVLLDTYVVYLRDQYRLYMRQNHREVKEERNRKARLAGRRMTLYLSRLRAASIRPHLKHICDLLLNMDASNMSEDERVEPFHAPVYECYYPEWQSEQMRTCFEALDELYREDWGAGNKAGNPPRTRYPNEQGTTVSTPAPKGLPRNCYNQEWLATLSAYRLEQYDIQDVEVDLSVAD